MVPLRICMVFLCGSLVLATSTILHDIDRSLSATDLALSNIVSRWEVSKFPNFLESCYMNRKSWDHLRAIFERRILLAYISTGVKNFTISFTGSSVTAGHDSNFHESFSELVGDMIKPALSDLRINLVSRNVAFGNNPCMPYDVCVRTFAGDDSDIVHWEQVSYLDA